MLTDIGPKPDPDDGQSLIRLLLYGDVIEIEGIVASTAAMRDYGTHEDYITSVIDGPYRRVRPNLLQHSAAYPTADALLDRVFVGNPRSGMRAVGSQQDSPASDALLRWLREPEERPLWVLVWGGSNVLAQALWRGREELPPARLAKGLAGLRVYAIADQDDTGRWIRESFPDLFYIVSPGGYTETPAVYATLISLLTLGSRFKSHTHAGMHGRFPGADNDITGDAWIEANVREGHGPLGDAYPRPRLGMGYEGDSPTILHLVPNGLGYPERPDWGSWGGRYERTDASRNTYTDTEDTVLGRDGRRHTSNYATLWRWREAFQNDFAARVDWSIAATYEAANHPPLPRVEGPSCRPLGPGRTTSLDARGSSDPDGDRLRFRWFHYPEAGTGPAAVHIEDPTSAWTAVRVDPVEPSRPGRAGDVHVILEATDDGEPPLTRYQRVILLHSM